MNQMDAVLLLLRHGLPGACVTGFIAGVDQRSAPIVHVRRVGGAADTSLPGLLVVPVVEVSAYSTTGLADAERLYARALDVLRTARFEQTVTAHGWVCSLVEQAGPTVMESPFPASWLVTGTVSVGVRTPRQVVVPVGNMAAQAGAPEFEALAESR